VLTAQRLLAVAGRAGRSFTTRKPGILHRTPGRFAVPRLETARAGPTGAGPFF